MENQKTIRSWPNKNGNSRQLREASQASELLQVVERLLQSYAGT